MRSNSHNTSILQHQENVRLVTVQENYAAENDENRNDGN